MQRIKFAASIACLMVASAQAQDDAITASEVVDRPTLEAFVLRAKAVVESLTSPAELLAAYADFDAEGEWKSGSIYLFVSDRQGTSIFHGADASLQGQDLSGLTDSNGVLIVQELLAAAANGGGFVEYLWDDPAVEGDEEIGSPKVSYAAELKVLGLELIIGSGFYPSADAAPTAVEGVSWGAVKGRL